MATSEEYAAWIVKNADKKGTPEFETVAEAYKASRAAAPKAEPAKSNSLGDDVVDTLKGAGAGFGKLALGLQRFAGKALEFNGDSSPTLTSLVTGQKPQSMLGRAGKWLVDDAESGIARLNKENALSKAASPTLNGVGEFGGTLALPIGRAVPAIMRAGTAAKGLMGMLQRVGQSAGTGAIYGGVLGTAHSQADTVGGMLEDGAKSAGVSAALGGLMTPVAAAVGAVGSNAVQRVSKTSAAEYAKQKIAEAFARDARGTLAAGGYTNPLSQAAARLSKLGPEATMADAGGRNTNQLLDTLAVLPGRTKEAAYNLLRQRTAGVGDRMRTAAEDALGTQGQRLPTTVESLLTRRETDSAPLYAQLRQTSIVPSDDLKQIVAAADELGATRLGKEIATARQQPFTLDPAKPDSWKMSDLDHVKQGIDQVLSSRKAMNPDSSLTPLGTAYQSLKTRLLGELDKATTNPQTGESLYRNARAAFSEPSKLIDAANAGKLAMNRDEASILSTIKGMSGNELQAFRIGAFEGLRGKLGTQGGQTSIMSMWKEPATQEKLKAVFGDLRSYREFAASVAKEAQLKRLQSVGAGSQTAARAAGMGDLDLSAMTEAGGAMAAAKSGNLLSALGSAKNVWNRVATPQSVRDQMGSLLLTKGPMGTQHLNSLEALVQDINNRNMLTSNNIGMFGGGLGGKLVTPTPSQLK